jgi:hypothetical protein
MFPCAQIDAYQHRIKEQETTSGGIGGSAMTGLERTN